MNDTTTEITQYQDHGRYPSKAMIEIAEQLALSSTCCSKHVAAIIYNYKTGTPLAANVNKSIITDCDRLFNKKTHSVHSNLKRLIEMPINYNPKQDWTVLDIDTFEQAHDMFVERYEVHAEMNVINMLNTECKRKELALFCTWEPCINCLKHIVNFGIRHVFYLNKYRKVSKCQIEAFEEFLGVEHENISNK